MNETAAPLVRSNLPAPKAVLELFKPITWFAPMWAFMCGVVSSGAPFSEKWPLALAGAILAGPMICATSQAVNDWFDRHVDAINEPNRPIPSGRIPGRWGLWIAMVWTIVSLLFATTLGPWVLVAATLGIVLAWAYSAPPFRLKQSGWWGPASVGFSYEGLTWFTGAAVVTQTLPDIKILLLAGLYAAGAHGIMTLNDFKAVEGDRQLGLRSLPVVMGVDGAARFAC
jgi:chlorophyll synthase